MPDMPLISHVVGELTIDLNLVSYIPVQAGFYNIYKLREEIETETTE